MTPRNEHANGRDGRRQIEPRAVAELLLDWRNPRLALDEDPGQPALLRRMFEEEALEELATSFLRNGYFWEEPIVVVPSERAGQFVAVEGNRRLASLKLLLSAQLRARVGAEGFPSATGTQAERLRQVPTVTYATREEVVPYLGFRHITGTKKWEPYSKARYIAQLIESDRPINSIEEAIGDSERAVKRLYQAYVLYNQIGNELDLSQSEIRESFSLLEVALGQQSIKTFLGVERALPRGRIERVVPEARLDNLRQLVSWIFGNKEQDERRIISDSRQIGQRLAPVLADEIATAHLRTTRDLQGAYERSGGDRIYFGRQVGLASNAVERALGVAPIVKGQSGVHEEVRRLTTLVESLSQATTT